MINTFLIFVAVFVEEAASSAGDYSLLYRGCTDGCRDAHSCPLSFDSCGWTIGSCFSCRYKCMWKTVDMFVDQHGFVPQFHGKWPFIAVQLPFLGLFDLTIQEPASLTFSLMNLYSVWIFLKYVKSTRSNLENRLLWRIYASVGLITCAMIGKYKETFFSFNLILMLANVMSVSILRRGGMRWIPALSFTAIKNTLYWELDQILKLRICSALFHARDCWVTEYLDYFSAFAYILSASYVSFCFTLPWISDFWNRPVVFLTYGAVLLLWFVRHVHQMLLRFDYGYNMRCCIGVSLYTTLMYLLYIAIRRRHYRRLLRSDRMLILIIVWTNGSVLLETLDFEPIFWIIDAHSLFHAATVPLPFYLKAFLQACIVEKTYRLDKLGMYDE